MKKINSMAQWLKNGSFQRELTYNFYLTKYFNLFMGAYKFKGITREQQDYILRKLWAVGSIGAFVVEGTQLEEGEVPSDVNQYPNGMIAFCQFAPVDYNIYDWPIRVNLIQSRGAKFIPTSIQVVDKDVVIGYAQRSKKPVLAIVDYYLEKIVNVEMTIKNQLASHKVPWMVATTSESEERVKRLFERIQNDEEALYVNAGEIEAIKSLVGGNTYIIDKLFSYKQALENELLTYLGIDNLGVMEKKEHLIGDEVNSNNAIIDDHSDNFLSCLKDWCNKIKEVFDISIEVEATSSPKVATQEADQEDIEKESDEYDE